MLLQLQQLRPRGSTFSSKSLCGITSPNTRHSDPGGRQPPDEVSKRKLDERTGNFRPRQTSPLTKIIRKLTERKTSGNISVALVNQISKLWKNFFFC